MIVDIYAHQRAEVNRANFNLKQSIAKLEAIIPRTPEIEAELCKSKEIEKQLCEAAKDSGFIKNLTEQSLKQTYIKSKNYTEEQQAKRAKRQTWKGLTPLERAKRNKEIIVAWKNSKLKKHNFARIQSEKRKLSISQIKNIIEHSK